MTDDAEPAAEITVEVLDANDEITLLGLSGELDLTNTSVLTDVLEPFVRPEAAPSIIFDLSELRFIDSSGFAVLLGAASRGKSVRIRHPSKVVQEVIALTGLDHVVEIEP